MVAEQLRRPIPGGIGTYIRGLLQGLAALAESDGAAAPDVTLWASRPARAGPDPLAALGRPLLTAALPAAALVRSWDRGMGRVPAGFDLFHAPSFALPPGGAHPLTVMVHDLGWRHLPDAYPSRGRRWHEAALGRALRRARLLIVPSESVAGDLLAAGAAANRVEVIEEGCDHLDAPDDAGAGHLLGSLGVTGEYLLTVSTVEPRKNLPRLLAAYDLARARLPYPWPLVVVGPSGWGPAVRPVPGALLAGPVSGGVLTALLRRTRLLAYVPLREGFGLPVVEAMACGAAVVASAVPSAGGAALLVDPLDVDGIAAALVRVAGDDATRADLVAAGLARTSGLTWEAAARGHAELWSAVMTGPGGRSGTP